MEKQITNLTPEYFLNNKNDKVYKHYLCFTSKINVYVTRTYKIIRIDNLENSIIINIFHFCELLLNSYLRLKHINLCDIKIKFNVNYNVRTFELYKDKLFILKLTYSKCKLILKDLIPIYKSHVINLKNFNHIENKKKEIDIMFKHFKVLKINSKNFNDHISSKKLISDISNVLFDNNICNKVLYLYILNKF